MERKDDILDEVTSGEYKYGFVTDIDTETFPKGLSEEVVRRISRIKGEPGWMTDYRLKAYRHWLTLTMPRWPHLDLPEIDFQDISYYAAPKKKPRLASMDEVDPELKATFDKLGVPLEEQMLLSGVAVDAVMDSVSVKTTFKETLAEKGIVFTWQDSLLDYLVKKSYSAAYGARNLRRLIQKELEDAIASRIIDSWQHPVARLDASSDGEQLVLSAL